MTTRSLRPTVLLAALLLTASIAHAQLPTDNDVWKTRCNLLSASAPLITSGTAPAPLVAATRRVPGPNFSRLAVDRAQQNNHYVACTLFYLAAIADRAGNDTSAAAKAETLAAGEVKQAHGQSLSFSENIAWAGVKLSLATGGVNLTAADTTAILAAATTMPLTLASNPQMASIEARRTPKI